MRRRARADPRCAAGDRAGSRHPPVPGAAAARRGAARGPGDRLLAREALLLTALLYGYPLPARSGTAGEASDGWRFLERARAGLGGVSESGLMLAVAGARAARALESVVACSGACRSRRLSPGPPVGRPAIGPHRSSPTCPSCAGAVTARARGMTSEPRSETQMGERGREFLIAVKRRAKRTARGHCCFSSRARAAGRGNGRAGPQPGWVSAHRGK